MSQTSAGKRHRLQVSALRAVAPGADTAGDLPRKRCTRRTIEGCVCIYIYAVKDLGSRCALVILFGFRD